MSVLNIQHRHQAEERGSDAALPSPRTNRHRASTQRAAETDATGAAARKEALLLAPPRSPAPRHLAGPSGSEW